MIDNYDKGTICRLCTLKDALIETLRAEVQVVRTEYNILQQTFKDFKGEHSFEIKQKAIKAGLGSNQ
jgi:hypothetical protein